jgi:selenocysteine-specific elongation factor
VILGTAGHIDHGKTTLVQALTGVDTDRLPEEKRRGITIDLGFAPLRLDDGTVLGVVDVPGHEAFVRTMLAGATGIDVALLVIAADEGPMPQTREHLAILELLGVPKCVVALTKKDLADPEWLALVTEDVRGLLSATPFATAEIIAVSAVSGEGLPQLREAIRMSAESREPRAKDDVFRLPVDRAFSVKGTGTVVTGTVWSGTLSVDDIVRVMPLGASVRVRGLQNHGAAVQAITPGMRAAVALAGIEPQAAGRGATLVTNPAWEASMMLRADLTMLPEAPELRPRTRVRFHLATNDVGARVVATGGPVSAGSRRTVRVVLDEPIMARTGDRFVLRSASPLATIGGGIVTDSNAPRRARPMSALAMPLLDRFELLVAEAGGLGLPVASLPIRLGAEIGEAAAPASTRARRVGDRWYAADVIAAARNNILKLVRTHHDERPLDPGAPRQDIRSRLSLDERLFEALVSQLSGEDALSASGGDLRIAGWAPALSGQQQQATDQLVAALEAAGSEPPSVSELEQKFGKNTLTLLKHLERQGLVVQVEDTRFYSPKSVRELVAKLEQGMAGRGEVAPADLKEVLAFSRKFLIPFLEYCDRRGLTMRQGTGRVWRGAGASR